MSNEIQEYRTEYFGDNSNIIIMDEIPEYDKEDYDLFNAKDFKKYVDDIERVVRTSYEYREFVNYLRNYMDMNRCAFFKNVTNANTTKIKIHIHHHPFTLYDIAMTVYNKRCANRESLEVEIVAKEVMYIHYFLYVGLVPLAETVHELVHNQLLFVPLNIVMGKYDEFIDMYKDYVPEDAMDRFHTYEEMTKTYNEITNTHILEISPVYLKLPGDDPNALGAYGLPKLADIVDKVKNRVLELKAPQNAKGLIIDTTYDSNSSKMVKPFYFITDNDIKPQMQKPFTINV